MADMGQPRTDTRRTNGVEQRAGATEDEQPHKSRKRRKVNHACVYCRRSHMTCDQQRPCSRCIKRDIGHLCHDEPGEATKSKRASNTASSGDPTSPRGEVTSPSTMNSNPPLLAADGDVKLDQSQLVGMDGSDEIQGVGGGPVDAQGYVGNGQPYFNDWSFGAAPSQFQDMHSFHPNYMFNTSEATNEYNLLNEFLNTSFLDEGGMPNMYQSADPLLFSDPSLSNYVEAPQPPPTRPLPESSRTSAVESSNSTATQTSRPLIKAQEKYYMTAADPAGTESGEERMRKLLQAKYDAGLLKPYNYVKGYSRLQKHMDETMQPSSKQRIVKQLEQFRPKFRQRMQRLADVEVVMVEMWFERKLMEYDRVFASMAVPACCWRRTGEIFRGNGEMSELIGVPVDELRDGKLALHDIMAEQSLVTYWETFGSVAFDASQKAIWLNCEIKSRGLENGSPGVKKCCFSFVIQRDNHAIPSLIIGNFLPILAPKK